jgi:hypothetical protein
MKIRGVQIEEEIITCFVSMKVFSFIDFSSFPIPKQTLGQ